MEISQNRKKTKREKIGNKRKIEDYYRKSTMQLRGIPECKNRR